MVPLASVSHSFDVCPVNSIKNRTDIPVNGRVVIPSKTTSFLKDTTTTTSTVSEIGNTIFDYVPAHPALSNPKTLHRYVVSVWKQASEKLAIDKEEWKKQASQEREQAKSLSSFNRIAEGEGELKMEYRERGIPFPTMRFAQAHNLELAGFAFFTSTFNVDSPKLFQDLGILIIPHQSS